MKTILATAAFATIIVSLCFLPAQADLAHWADAQARAQIASQLVADNMHYMK